VTTKRTNRPGISTTNRPPRGRFRPRSSYHYGYAPRPRGRFRLEPLPGKSPVICF